MVAEPKKQAMEKLELRRQDDWPNCGICEGAGTVGTARSVSRPICPECNGLGMAHVAAA